MATKSDNLNTIALFPTDATAPRAPDYKGNIIFDKTMMRKLPDGSYTLAVVLWERNKGVLSGIVEDGAARDAKRREYLEARKNAQRDAKHTKPVTDVDEDGMITVDADDIPF